MFKPASSLCECQKSPATLPIHIFCISNVVNGLERVNGHFGVKVSGLNHEKWKSEQTQILVE